MWNMLNFLTNRIISMTIADDATFWLQRQWCPSYWTLHLHVSTTEDSAVRDELCRIFWIRLLLILRSSNGAMQFIRNVDKHLKCLSNHTIENASRDHELGKIKESATLCCLVSCRVKTADVRLRAVHWEQRRIRSMIPIRIAPRGAPKRISHTS